LIESRAYDHFMGYDQPPRQLNPIDKETADDLRRSAKTHGAKERDLETLEQYLAEGEYEAACGLIWACAEEQAAEEDGDG
jgi:hypothetical protein